MSEPELPPRPAVPPTWRERLADTLSAHPAPSSGALVAGAVALVVVGVLGYLALRPPPPAPEISLPMAGSAAEPTTPPPSSVTTAPAEVVVHAAGAVVRAGLYRLPAGARVADLVDAAGGLTPDADTDRLNLAALLEDGRRVYVLHIGELSPPVIEGGDPGVGSVDEDGVVAGGGGPTPDDPVDINTAGLAELDSLPGIGPTIAQAIIQYRDDHGAFQSVDQLLDVPGIGEAKLADLRELVTV